MNNAAAAARAASDLLLARLTHNSHVIVRVEGRAHRGTVVTLPTDRDPSGHPVGAYLVAVAGLGHCRVQLDSIMRLAGPLR